MIQGISLRQFVMQPLRALSALVVVITVIPMSATLARAQTLTTIYSFCAQSGCSDGARPYGGLVQAADGQLWGTTQKGGRGGRAGGGTIFKITSSGILTTVYKFCSEPKCADGADPSASLVLASNGDLYGTASYGGTYKAPSPTGGGGTVVKITSSAVTPLDSFCFDTGCPAGVAPSTGSTPAAPLVQAPNEDLYGTTEYGGVFTYDSFSGGTIYNLTPSGTLTTLYNFCSKTNCADGDVPTSLVLASDGNFYGSTSFGGAYAGFPNGGTIFKITPSGKLTTIYSFCAQSGCPDGARPNALVVGPDGNLYGTTNVGGNSYGTVFKITPSGKLTTLYSFQGSEGALPSSALVLATDGNFYGTTSQDGVYGGGSVFSITLGGTLTTLYSFCGNTEVCSASDGANPPGNLIQATDGNFYGMTNDGGVTSLNDSIGEGTVFKVSVGLGPFVALQTTSGEVGAKVTILGTDLTEANSVTFNGTPATFTINSIGTAITAIVPTGATTGTVQVVTPNGILKSNVVYRVK